MITSRSLKEQIEGLVQQIRGLGIELDMANRELDILRETPDGHAFDAMQELASNVGCNGSWEPKTVDDLKRRISDGIDMLVSPWKRLFEEERAKHEATQAKLDLLLEACEMNDAEVRSMLHVVPQYQANTPIRRHVDVLQWFAIRVTDARNVIQESEGVEPTADDQAGDDHG